MGRGDLQEARGHLRLAVVAVRVGDDHVVVADDRDHAIHDRQFHKLADELGARCVVWIHSHGRVAEHRLGTRRRDGGKLPRLIAFAIADRILHVIEVPVHVLHLDFVVRQCGLADRVPVDQALAAVDQAVLEELEERLTHRLGALVIHRESLPVPVTAAAHLFELLGDLGLVFVFPRGDLADELPSAVFAFEFLLLVLLQRGLAFLLEAFVDDSLGRDARVVGAGHPERVEAAHAVDAREHILQRVVQRVAQVQRSGDVRRGDHDRVRLAVCIRRSGVGLGLEVLLEDGRLDLGRVVGRRQFGGFRLRLSRHGGSFRAAGLTAGSRSFGSKK